MKLVLDTNIVLDLFVFRDDAVRGLHEAIAGKQAKWLATDAMRNELESVLAYEQIGSRLAAAELSAQQVLDAFDAHAEVVAAAAVSKITCRDTDDQKFIDLAVAHEATLLSKDAQVLALRRKLAPLQVVVARSL